ncbi:MAG TPA: phosphodiester glycosidase family protein [Aggregatilinea sp.]|uniref:phosphodiester glycosidase family protein n=1 Tax=Aggregatilinea sp. TaxID=2806333 RepID=UPI002C463321|nr:phosphodiester glycosidase family protein [Aggregatilinea sp.]HML20850.1 phosphodiester glycosidase family protein [Aggregatilinea sp.]
MRWLRWAIAALALMGCTLARGVSDLATSAPSPLPPTPTRAPTVPPETGWQSIAPGIEYRNERVTLVGGGSFTAVEVRIDPALVTFRVHYRPGDALGINGWSEQIPDAAVIVNAGFFDEADRSMGLVISDGQVSGESFAGFGGMFQVDAYGARVRSLVSEPYYGEDLYQAVQAFPMLVEAGGIAAPQGDGFSEGSRRTVAAQDRTGRILFIAVPVAFVSFADLQAWLLASDLDVSIAFALDGGKSTAMVIRGPDPQTFPALDGLPAVIAVYPS